MTSFDWVAKLPEVVVFVDVETTGFHSDDRIVSFAGIWLNTRELMDSKYHIRHVHLIFNPEKKCHRKASEVHGYVDRDLENQDKFSDWADQIYDFLESSDVIVGYNVRFDIRYIRNELISAIGRAPAKPIHCAMEQSVRLGLEGRDLDAVVKELGMSRSGRWHSALEDAWLTMNVYLLLSGSTLKSAPFTMIGDPSPSNMKPVQRLAADVPAELAVHGVSGKSFVFTGELDSMRREEAGALVEAAGGVWQPRVRKDTDFLVIGHLPGGTKLNMAAKRRQQYGRLIEIDEAQFLSLIRRNTP